MDGEQERSWTKRLKSKLPSRFRKSSPVATGTKAGVSFPQPAVNSHSQNEAGTARAAVKNGNNKTDSTQSAAELSQNVYSIPNPDDVKDSITAVGRSERVEVGAAQDSHRGFTISAVGDVNEATGIKAEVRTVGGSLETEILDMKCSSVAPAEKTLDGLWASAYHIVELETDPDFRLSEAEIVWLQEAKRRDFGFLREDLWSTMRANNQEWERTDKNGHTFSIRDRVHNILRSVDKYSTVVSTGINHSPEITSLVWAGLQFMLQIALNGLEALECLEEAVSTITEQMAYGEFYASMYAGSLKFEDGLESQETTEVMKKITGDALPQLYAAILVFFVKARTYFEKDVKKRVAKYLIPFSESLGPFVTRIEVSRKTLEGLADAAMMERIKASSKKIEKIEKLLQDQNTIKIIQDGFALAELNKRVAGGASFNSQIASEHKKSCLPGTRKELLTDILRWSRSSDPATKSIYWLTGMGGTGKSTIAMTAAQTFDNEGRLGASFFFDRDQGGLGLNNASKFFPTLAVMLVRRIPELLPFMQEAIKDVLILDGRLDQQSRKLLLEPLQHLATRKLASRHEMFMSETDSESPIILVIDALDECNSTKDSKIILEALAAIGSISSIRIRTFITSRPEVHIETDFGSQFLQEKHHCLNLRDIESQIVDVDILAYLKHEMRAICIENNIAMPDDWILQRVCDNAHRLFIYATTVCRLLRQHLELATSDHKEALELALADYRELDGLYSKVLEYSLRAFEDKGPRNRTEQAFVTPLRKILGCIIVIFTPQPATSIAYLTKMETRILNKFLGFLRSILEISKIEEGEAGNVRFLHPSFRDFIADQARCGSFWVDQSQMHEDIFLRCIEVMSDTLKENICSLPLPFSSPTEVEEGHLEHVLPTAVRYACRYWIQHLEKSQHDKILKHDEKIGNFLKKHFLHWLEALSLLGIVPEGILAIKALRSIWTLKAHPESHVHEILRHAERVIVKNRRVIENAPLQAYTRAVLWTPRSLPFVNIPRWIETRPPQRADDWDPLLQAIIHPDIVDVVAFSSDGKHLASGCRDGKIYIWDVATGVLFGSPFEGHSDGVQSVAFSPNGAYLASGSLDGTMRLWNVATGLQVQGNGFSGHDSWVNSVAFSPDGAYLASGSFDKTIRLWEVATGVRVNVSGFSGSGYYVTSVAFSPDGKHLASASFCEAVRLWDVETGLQVNVNGFSGDDEDYWLQESSLAFSPDGEHLVTRSKKKIRIWNVATGKPGLGDSGTAFASVYDYGIASGISRDILLDPGFSGRFTGNVAFSSDGKHIACGYSYLQRKTLIWDAFTGDLLKTIDNRSARIASLVFSPTNGKLLATASGVNYNSVMLWDTLIPALPRNSPDIQSVEGHTKKVTCSAFSPCENLAVTGSDDATLRLWDTVTGVSTTTFKGHTYWIREVSFSPDGRYFASGANDGTVRLWDVTTGVTTATFEGPTDWNCGLTFSPDGRYLAAMSRDNLRIWLWDVATGVRTATFECHSKLVNSIAISPDGKYIAANLSFGGTFQVWDVAKGDSITTFKGDMKAHAITFSSDGKLFASGSDDGRVRLWDMVTKQLVHKFKTEIYTLKEISFSEDGNILKTNAGVCVVGPDVGSERHGCDANPMIESMLDWYFIEGGQWIAYGDQKVLWLPPDYQGAKFSRKNDTLVFGLRSGEVAIFKLNRKILEEEFRNRFGEHSFKPRLLSKVE